jgi:Glycerophosphoryl diester phosphodiesterase
MEKIRKQRNHVYINSTKLIFQNGLSLLLGQGIILFLFIILLTPSIAFIYRLTLSVTKFSHIAVENIGRFFLNPINLIMAVMLFYLVGLFLLAELYYLITFFTMINLHKKVNVLRVVFSTLAKVLYGLVKGNLKLIPIAWMTMALLNIPLFVFIFSKTRLMRYVFDEMPENLFWIMAVVIFIGLIFVVFFKRPYIFHYFLIERMNYPKALAHSKKSTNRKPIRTFFYFLGWNVLIGIIVSILYAFTMAVTILFASGTFDKRLAIATIIEINEKLKMYLFTVIFLIDSIGNLALFTHLFDSYRMMAEVIDPEADLTEHLLLTNHRKKQTPYKKFIIATAVIIVLTNFYFFINILENGSPLDNMNLGSIKVTSHRGFSQNVPENTIPAIEKAIKEKADYVEVDVRLTKDGELVLLHDTNLRRTTGLNKNIWDVNYDEVATLDAGSWMGKRFKGTRIPTLREVFELCKGKIFINMDLKYTNPDKGLEEKVVSLIKEYNMEWQCVISSTNLSTLKKIKDIDPDIRTGYITYQLYSGITKKDEIDFFSMKSDLITKSVLQSIHKEGKELYVWTVNSKPELERLERIGVDNIITDNPAYVKEVLYNAESDWYFTTLFKIIME